MDKFSLTKMDAEGKIYDVSIDTVKELIDHLTGMHLCSDHKLLSVINIGEIKERIK